VQTKAHTLAAVLSISASIVSASAQTKIYWTETRFEAGLVSGSFLMSADADGSNAKEMVSGSAKVLGPNGLEYGNGTLFWPDQQLNIVSKSNPDGTAANMFVGASNPYDVFVGTDRVYWTSQTGNYIDSAKLDGTDSGRILSRSSLRFLPACGRREVMERLYGREEAAR